MKLRLRNKRWWIDGRYNGARIRLSCGTDVREQAEAYLVHVEENLMQHGTVDKPKPLIPNTIFVADYREVREEVEIKRTKTGGIVLRYGACADLLPADCGDSGLGLGTVYCLQNASGLVKIGLTEAPRTRILALQRSTGYTLFPIYLSVPSIRHQEIEARAHAHFHQTRQQGEWFACVWKEAVQFLEGAMADWDGNRGDWQSYLEWYKNRKRRRACS